MTKNLDKLFGEDVLTIECGNCGKELSISFSDIGSSVVCPHCSTVIELIDADDSEFDQMEKAAKDFLDNF